MKQFKLEHQSKSLNHKEKEEKNHQNKIILYGYEMFEKEVKTSGNSGRVYLPPSWIGKKVKVIRLD